MSEKTRRRTVARHGQLRSPGPVSQLLKFLAIAAAVVLVSGVGVAAFSASTLLGNVSANAVELEGGQSVPPNISEYKGGFDLLLTGLDTCEPEYAHLFPGRCDGPDADGNLNDVNLLVHVSEEPRRITAVSFPRDLIVDIPECTDEDGNATSEAWGVSLNSAYRIGGLNCVAKTITELTGQDIEFAASIKFGGVIEITNAIGGVEVCLASPIRDSHTLLDMSAGTHTISGLQALQFLRTRHGVGDGSDLGRISNQQVYMSSLARKLVSGEVLGNVPVMMRLANTALSNIEPSTTLSENPLAIVQIALAVKDVGVENIVFLQYPTFTDPNDPNKVVPDEESAEAMWDAINANKQLQVTHQPTDTDGAVVESPAPTQPPADAGETTAPETTAPDATAPATPTPAETAVALPEEIRGTSADQTTCSNGKTGE